MVPISTTVLQEKFVNVVLSLEMSKVAHFIFSTHNPVDMHVLRRLLFFPPMDRAVGFNLFSNVSCFCFSTMVSKELAYLGNNRTGLFEAVHFHTLSWFYPTHDTCQDLTRSLAQTTPPCYCMTIVLIFLPNMERERERERAATLYRY